MVGLGQHEIGTVAGMGPLGKPPTPKYERPIARAKQVRPEMTVVAYPCDETSLRNAINIFPDLDAKQDIVQNAIDSFTQVGLGTPREAILSANSPRTRTASCAVAVRCADARRRQATLPAA